MSNALGNIQYTVLRDTAVAEYRYDYKYNNILCKLEYNILWEVSKHHAMITYVRDSTTTTTKGRSNTYMCICSIPTDRRWPDFRCVNTRTRRR